MNRKTVAPVWYISIIAKECVISRHSHPAPEGYRSNAKHFGLTGRNWLIVKHIKPVYRFLANER